MGKKYLTRKRKYVLAALSMALVLALVLQMAGTTARAADAIDLSKECTLTVQTAGDEAYREDLRGAKVVLDVYKVAEAEKIQGVDSYTYKLLPPFEDLFESLGKSEEDKLEFTSEDWRRLSLAAGEIAFGWKLEENGTKPGGLESALIDKALPLCTDPQMESSVDKFEIGIQNSMNDSEPLACGLYLVVARGSDLGEDYAERVTMKFKVKEKNGETEEEVVKEEEVLVSSANSSTYRYHFMPELISIPGKPEDENVVGDHNTANPGEWIYNMAATLKPEREQRFGSLNIVKTLSSYETAEGVQEPVTFVFSIEARMGDDPAFENNELVYSNVVSVTYTGPGRGEPVTLDRIPAGARVKVTEVYSGSSYTAEYDSVDGIVIAADTVAEAEFTNVYNGRNRKGYGINNHFSYEEGEDGNGWSWEHSDWTWGPWEE